MKNYVQPKLIVKLVTNVLLGSPVDLTETDYFDFNSNNPWGGNQI